VGDPRAVFGRRAGDDRGFELEGSAVATHSSAEGFLVSELLHEQAHLDICRFEVEGDCLAINSQQPERLFADVARLLGESESWSSKPMWEGNASDLLLFSGADDAERMPAEFLAESSAGASSSHPAIGGASVGVAGSPPVLAHVQAETVPVLPPSSPAPSSPRVGTAAASGPAPPWPTGGDEASILSALAGRPCVLDDSAVVADGGCNDGEDGDASQLLARLGWWLRQRDILARQSQSSSGDSVMGSGGECSGGTGGVLRSS